MENKENEKCVIGYRKWKWAEDTEKLTVQVPKRTMLLIEGTADLTGRTIDEVAQQFLMFGAERLEISKEVTD